MKKEYINPTVRVVTINHRVILCQSNRGAKTLNSTNTESEGWEWQELDEDDY